MEKKFININLRMHKSDQQDSPIKTTISRQPAANTSISTFKQYPRAQLYNLQIKGSMTTHYRNRAKVLLQQLTPQAIEQFDRDQVLRKLGLDQVLTPQEREQCQQTIALLRKKLALFDEMQASAQNKYMKQRQAVTIQPLLSTTMQQLIPVFEQSQLPIVKQQMPAMKLSLLPISEIPLLPIIQAPLPLIAEKPSSDMKQPSQMNEKDGLEEDLSSKQEKSRFFLSSLSRFYQIGSRPQLHHNNSLKRDYSSAFAEDEEQTQSLLSTRDYLPDLSRHTQPTWHKKKLD